MNKWYSDVKDDSVIISSRIRLARNLKEYPFSIAINNDDSKKMIDEIKNVVSDSEFLNEFEYIDFDSKTSIEKLVMLENHSVSRLFLSNKKEKGLILKKDEKISIMLNEEDHIRLQSISYGDDIDNAYYLANKVDDLLEEKTGYAFHKQFGYLTSCPTNVGTGLRASYMIHIPMLSQANQMGAILSNINKFGLTLRGSFGEGTEAVGHIYQISNQITIGKSEKEIIDSLKQITYQLIENESYLRNQALEINRIDWEDKAYRSYGILANAKKISEEESINLLSNIRLGFLMNILNVQKPKTNIYNIIMNIRSGNIQKRENRALNKNEREIYRAKYLQSVLL